MAVYIGETERDKAALRTRAHRQQLARLYRGVYTDELDGEPKEIVRRNVLAIAAALLPDWQLCYSSAAVRGTVDGLLFVSGPGKPGRHLELPGVKIVRLPELTAPEYDRIETLTPVIRGVDRPPETLYIRISTPLQTLFECLARTRRYPEKSLPDDRIVELIERLPSADRERAERFAARNGLRREYMRYRGLSFAISASDRTRLAEPDAAELYFYGWRVGTLTYLGAGEYRFMYDGSWPFELSTELPLVASGLSYEGRRMPAFFENCLPEGWTESVVLASNKLSRDDLFGLLSTTRKYLSNLTLRPLGIPEEELVYDAHDLRIEALPRAAGNVILLREEIGEEPGDTALWRRTRRDGPLRLSGVQAKLPVALEPASRRPVLRIGDLLHPCTHILKVAAQEHPGLIENEWATMELARRIGLPVAPVAMVEFQAESRYRDRSLLVERYDIPDRLELERGAADVRLILQEDACSLLLLRRDEKYRTSMERVADALLDAGLSPEPGGEGLWRFLQLVVFSWIAGNGDLHAKNVSVLRRFRIGRPGEPPTPAGVEHAPLYDLVNTRVHVPGDDFALPVSGRRNNLRLKSFAALAARWDTPIGVVRSEVERMADAIEGELDGVLAESGLPEDLAQRYRRVVQDNLAGLGI